MKFKYEMTIMDVGDECVAVPVGEGAMNFKAVIKLNETAREIFELLIKYEDSAKVFEELCLHYPDSDKEEIRMALDNFLKICLDKGLIE